MIAKIRSLMRALTGNNSGNAAILMALGLPVMIGGLILISLAAYQVSSLVTRESELHCTMTYSEPTVLTIIGFGEFPIHYSQSIFLAND